MNEIITEYGGGLFLLAEEEGLEDQLLGETRMLASLLTADYTRLLINPNLPKEQRIAIVGELLDGRVHPYMANFVKLMTERRLASALKGCFGEYERLYYEKFRVVRVLAESAVELSEAQKKRLEEKLTAHTGCRIEVRYSINPSLIGGMRLFYNNREINDSIKSRLTEIGAVLSDTVV
ncbi:MAG: ATP synthase F1 subunit delta [Clostridia bacterium]|nr:ATP synthase F1 subunit delta [Clostridia bacterium]